MVIAVLLASLQAVSGQDIPNLKPVKNLDEELVPVQKKDKWGYANAKGKVILKAVFDEAGEFKPATSDDGTTMLVARVRVGDKWGYITRENVYLFEPEFDSISEFGNLSVVVAQTGPNISLLGLRSTPHPKLEINVLTGTVLQVNLSEIKEFSQDGNAWAARAGRWGILNTKGKWILPCEYDSWTEVPGRDVYAIGRSGKTGICTFAGEVVVPAEYDSILPLAGGGYVVSGDAKSGVLADDGSVIIEPAFSSIAWDDKLGFVVSKDGLFGRYDASGREIYACMFKAVPDPELRGYEELIQSGAPAIYIAGDGLKTVKEYDDALFKQLGAASYATSPALPGWLKSHLAADGKFVTLESRMPAKVELAEDFDGSAEQCAGIIFKCGVSLADIMLQEGDESVFTPLTIWDGGSKVYVLQHAIEEYWDLYEFDSKTRTTRKFGVKGDMVCDYEAGFIAETGVWIEGDAPVANLTPMCFPASAKLVTMPIIRYRFRTWAGEAFAFAGASVDGEQALKAAVADSEVHIGRIMYGESDQYCDFSMRIRSASANGIALYELVGTEYVYDEEGELAAKTPRVMAYGYIGLSIPFFTQPIFYEAREFKEGKAMVRVGDEWLTMDAATISQMDPFIQPD